MHRVPSCVMLQVLLTTPLAAQQSVTRLEELQVTATRVSAPVASVPAAITVLQGSELRERGLVLVADALRDVPGMTVVQTGSYGAVTGLFLRGGESDYTKVLVDGVPINAPGGSLNLANLSLDNVERIEIVRGPGSVLHGADAVSGVIQIVTRGGAGRREGDLSWRAGSYGNSDLRGRLAAGEGEWRLSAAASRFASDGLYAFNNDYLDADGSLRLDWDGGRHGQAGVTVRYGDALARFPTDGAGVPDDINQRVIDRDLVTGLHLARAFGARVTLAGEAWLHRLDSRFRDPQDSAADTSGFGFSGTRDALATRRGAGLRLDWRPSGAVTLTGGVGLEREAETQHSVTRSDFGAGAFDDIGEFGATRVTRDAYVQLLARAPGHLDLQGGARLDDNSAFGAFATWRGGIVWHPVSTWRIWSSVGTGFKAPTFSELFARGAYEVGNPALDPERSTSIEFGVERRAGPLVLGITAFHQRFERMIQYLTVAQGEPTYGNLGAARSRGLEVAASLVLGGGVDLRVHWAWLGTAVTDSGVASSVTFRQGDPLLRRPAMSGGATLLARLTGARGSATLNWVGAREDADFRDFPATRITLPSYASVDLALEVPLVGTEHGGRGAVLLFRAENLLDATWQQAVGFPGRGRTLLVGGRLAL